eukprot:scaffold1663_cov171-Amphora_coffeaeformis.AAC.16
MAMTSTTTGDSLRGVYRQIANKAAYETPDWPASKDFCKLLDHRPQEHGTVFAPGICTEKFVQELVAIEPSQPLHVIPRTKVPHFCVFLVHEHPSFLSALQVQEDVWKHVDDDTMRVLVDDLSSVMERYKNQPIQLELDSILLTPDGAMIAGFVETTAGVYQGLKTECTETMKRRLGRLTSRPKNLIHATLGRILCFEDQGGNPQRQEQVQKIVRRYNDVVLPKFVQQLNNRTWRVQHMSMMRNTVWFCEENVIYKTWDLIQTKEESP